MASRAPEKPGLPIRQASDDAVPTTDPRDVSITSKCQVKDH